MTQERIEAIFKLDVTQKFILELFKFVSSFTVLEEKLKTELEAGDHSACFKTMMDICVAMKKIFAGDTANEFYQTMQLMRNKSKEEIEMFLAEFLVYAAMLSMDIQSALFKHDIKKAGVQPKVIEDGIASKLKLEKELVLAVDDTMLFLITLKSYVKDTGYNLVSYSTVEEVFEFLVQRRPALIFLGIDMAKMNMDGFGIAKKIRELGHDAPIVFMTGNASEKIVIQAMEMGAAGFIVKPATQSSILKILEQLIGIPELPPPVKEKKVKPEKLPEMPDFPELGDLPGG